MIQVAKLYPITTEPGDSLSAVVRRCFRRHAAWHDPADVDEEIESAFRVLRLGALRLEQVRDAQWQPKPAGIEFSVGQVVQHARYRYPYIFLMYRAPAYPSPQPAAGTEGLS